jgi:transcriptional regulator
MSRDLKYEKENIELRRGKVLELLAKGESQNSIAKILNCSPALISLDIQWIREQSKKELETHISDRLPFEYKRAVTGMNNVLKRVSALLDQASDPKTRMECLKLQMELYRSIMNMATDGGIIERAMKTLKVITPLPGEDIPTEEELSKEEEQGEEEDIKTREDE